MSPAEIAQTCVNAGVSKTQLKGGKMFLLAVLAGLFIAVGGIASAAASCTVENPSVAKLVGACVFPAGLSMVLLAGSELFTGNSLILVSVLEKKSTVGGFVRNLVIVYLGNLVGSVLLAALVVYGHTPSLFSGALAANIVATAQAKVALPFADALLRGILCNVLVCLAVWMSYGAKTPGGKVAALFFPIMAFVVCGFEHCVANMYYLPAGLFTAGLYGIDPGALTWGAALVSNLLPVTLGNLIGGMAVGLVYHTVYLRGAKKA